jgi:hypothetical protein
MEIYLSLLVALIGLLIYVLVGPPTPTPPPPNSKVAELGRIMFAMGLLAFLICMCNSPHAFGIVPK